jgi:hypothetical protein
MAQKEVVFTTCDRCYKEEQTDLQKVPARNEKFQLPAGWLHISGNTRSTTVFEMDLCGDCKGLVIEAAGRAPAGR